MNRKRQDLIKSLSENMTQLRRHMFSSLPPTQKGRPTFAQMGIMFILHSKPLLSLKEIASHFQISPSAATQLVDGLVKKKLILRNTDKKDGRKTTLKLTPLGKKNIEEIKKEHVKFFENTFNPLSEEELLTLDNLQKKIIAYLK